MHPMKRNLSQRDEMLPFKKKGENKKEKIL
jgi:hypothetical protein